MYKSTKPLCCTPETNIVNYNSMFKMLEGKGRLKWNSPDRVNTYFTHKGTEPGPNTGGRGCCRVHLQRWPLKSYMCQMLPSTVLAQGFSTSTLLILLKENYSNTCYWPGNFKFRVIAMDVDYWKKEREIGFNSKHSKELGIYTNKKHEGVREMENYWTSRVLGLPW